MKTAARATVTLSCFLSYRSTGFLLYFEVKNNAGVVIPQPRFSPDLVDLLIQLGVLTSIPAPQGGTYILVDIQYNVNGSLNFSFKSQAFSIYMTSVINLQQITQVEISLSEAWSLHFGGHNLI